jgi:hypothetical protein
MKKVLMVGCVIFFQSPLLSLAPQDPALISALAEMRGAINARMDAIDSKINEVTQFAKAAYAKSVAINDYLEKKDVAEKRILQLATGKESVDEWVKTMEQNTSLSGAATGNAATSAADDLVSLPVTSGVPR